MLSEENRSRETRSAVCSSLHRNASFYSSLFFFFNETATTEIYTSLHTLSLHDALPILLAPVLGNPGCGPGMCPMSSRSEEHTSELQSRNDISYAVFCLKKKKNTNC